MKYFKQTKETRRMLSFFLSLALIISLVPVSNKVAEAAEAKVTVTGKVTGATVGEATVTGETATIKVTAGTDYKFNSKDDVKAEVTVDSTDPAPTSPTTTGGAVEDATKAAVKAAAPEATLAMDAEGKVITITIANVTENITVKVSGSATEVKDTTPAKEYKYTINAPVIENVEYEFFKDGVKATTNGAITENATLKITISAKAPYAFAEGKAPVVKNGATEVTADSGSTSSQYIYSIAAKADIEVVITIANDALIIPAILGSTEAAPGSIEGVEVEGIKAPEKLDDVKITGANGEEVKLTDPEKAAIENGDSQLVLMLAATTAAPEVEDKGKEVAASVKGSEDVAKAVNTIPGVNVSASEIDNVNVGKVLDISIKAYIKDLKDTSKAPEEKGTYTKNDDSEVTITLDEADIATGSAADGKTRVYYVLHLDKDGKIKEVIPCTVSEDGKVSFKVKSFSTFVMCYSDITKTTGNGLANYPVSAPSATGTPAPTATAAPSASPSASATPTASTSPTDPDKGDNGSTGGDTGNTGNGNGTVNQPGDGGSDDGDNTTTTTKKKTISKLKVTAKKNAKQVKVTTIKKAKVVVTANRKVIKNGKKSVKKITITAAKNKKGNVTVKLNKKLKKGDKITVKVSKSGYKTKSKTVKVK